MRLNRSLLLAAIIAIGATGWIVSGQFANGARTDSEATATAGSEAKAPELTSVRIRESVSEPYRSAVVVAGRTAASRHIELKAQILGKVVKIGATEGAPVTGGETIIRFDPEDREAKRQMAKARIEQRETEFTAADKLANKGFQAKTQRAATYADLQEAKADLAEIEEEIRRLAIKAPFDAILDDIQVELGDVVQSGDPVATLYDLDPILVVAQVSEQERVKLAVGRPGAARLLDGTQLTGTIRYITAAADPQTRTFKVELEVPNPGMQIEQGITAGMVLPLPEILAHKLSAGIFTLNDDGQLGVMIVGEGGIVRFRTVTVVDSDADWAYVTGLPDRVKLISVGQEFVSDGEKVRAVPEAIVGTPEAKAS
ncbi:efflux RND transporter periplasmic adaptor subunit [Nisaea acidiphila]|uniref:Efflux RND transporter periplasmic adaptor subunit n=1 Tax=Nisaea acidiphila TaxID=1862145 RepID=A0A9J7APP2_9PROT|nr:efflux RND transporter periplasmic adaptor subunit [Nisaea acidiphila]UUX49183.1 efflux RND transporter periplasmic adaptor subunit [Nisaea acidiphila]